METMERETERIKVATESGKQMTLVCFQNFHDATSIGDQAKRWVPGMKRLALSDGSPVNRIDDDTFSIVATDEIVRRVR